MFHSIPDPEDRRVSPAAISSCPLLASLLEGSLERQGRGVDALPPSHRALTQDADDSGISSMSFSSCPLLATLLDGNLQRDDLGPDALSPPHRGQEASESAEGAAVVWSDVMNVEPEYYDCGSEAEPEYYDCGSEPPSRLIPENADCPSSGDDRGVTQTDKSDSRDEEEDVTIVEDERPAENTAVPAKSPQSTEVAVGEQESSKHQEEGQDEDIVVLLSDDEGNDRPRDEFFHVDVPGIPRADEEDKGDHVDVPSIPRADEEDRGDVVILLPTIEKEPHSHKRSGRKNIRDCYTRELDKRKTSKTGSPSEAHKKYVYFDMLNFLSPVIATKPAESKEADAHTEETNSSDVVSVVASSSRKRQGLTEEEKLLQLLPGNIKKKYLSKPEADDPDKHFLLSLLDDFKSVPQHLKVDAKLEIMAVLRKYSRSYSSLENCNYQFASRIVYGNPAITILTSNPSPSPSTSNRDDTFSPISSDSSVVTDLLST